MCYIIKRTNVTSNNLKIYSDLLSLVFPSTNKFTIDFLEWQYKYNPAGIVVGFDAFFNDQLVGHYATIPVKYLLKGKVIIGLLSLNTATHPNHRGKRLFTKLADRTYKEAKEMGYEFIVGVANANSTNGFVKKLGFELVSQLEVKFGLGKISSKPNSKHKFKPFWDDELLIWRLENSIKNYYFNSKKIYVKTNFSGIRAQLHQSNSTNFNLPSISPLLNIWIGIDEYKTKKGVFINLPTRFKPSPLNFIFKDLSGEIGSIKKKDLFFELIDFDAY